MAAISTGTTKLPEWPIIAYALLLCVFSSMPGSANASSSEPFSDRVVRVEEVRYPAGDGAILAASLRLPKAQISEPYPAVIVISGTGATVRGGGYTGIMAGDLPAKGIAVLQYDVRGHGRSTGASDGTIEDDREDVEAAVAYLRTRPDCDPDRIVLMGASQGAVVAPLVAARDTRIAGVVMLSGPVGPRGKMFTDIMRSNLSGPGRSPQIVESIVTATDVWMAARSEEKDNAEIARREAAVVSAFETIGFTPEQARGAVAALDNPVLLSMYLVAPDEAVAAVRAPVLAVYGSHDRTIAAEVVIPAAQDALANNARALVAVIPGVDHGFRNPRREGEDIPGQGYSTELFRLVDWWITDILGIDSSQQP